MALILEGGLHIFGILRGGFLLSSTHDGGDNDFVLIRVLKPGGWVQIVECYHMCQSDNGMITETHALRQWSRLYLRSLDGLKDLRAPLRMQDLLTAAGLVNIEAKMIPLPLCEWPLGMVPVAPLVPRSHIGVLNSLDPRQRQIGAAVREHIRHALISLSLFPFNKRLDMAADAIYTLAASASRDASDPSLKAYFPL